MGERVTFYGWARRARSYMHHWKVVIWEARDASLFSQPSKSSMSEMSARAWEVIEKEMMELFLVQAFLIQTTADVLDKKNKKTKRVGFYLWKVQPICPNKAGWEQEEGLKKGLLNEKHRHTGGQWVCPVIYCGKICGKVWKQAVDEAEVGKKDLTCCGVLHVPRAQLCQQWTNTTITNKIYRLRYVSDELNLRAVIKPLHCHFSNFQLLALHFSVSC